MRSFVCVPILVLVFLFLSSCGAKPFNKNEKAISKTIAADTIGMSKAYFAAGCFWCVEAIFESVNGVSEVISGYAGGTSESANYSAVGSGMSKHAESVEIYYDSKIISYETLLTVLFDSHDPTTLNRQGPDYGFQYRSGIFYSNEKERAAANAKIEELTDTKAYDLPITTLVDPLVIFFPAEDYHQNYERLHPNEGYILGVSLPRLNKFLAKHPELLKKELHRN